jgi:hypothetical protein
MTRPKTKILVDGGNPQETRQVKELLGFGGRTDDQPFVDCPEPSHQRANRVRSQTLQPGRDG